MTPKDDNFDIEAAKDFVRRAQLSQFMELIRWGEQGAPINTVVAGLRVVASYNQLLKLPENATYHDFLGFYIKHALGDDWWKAEDEVPDQKAHQLIQWRRKVQEFQLKHKKGDGLQSAPGKGVIGHYYRIAFNLHTLHHQGLVQTRLIKRLQNQGNFQGARYEMAVCAALVRAGFDIRLEDESKSPHKVCELVATHKKSGRSYAVEAKSRHIPGVLGHPKSAHNPSREEPKVSSLINEALKKVAEHPRVIWIDVNFPPQEGKKLPQTWGPVVKKQVHKLEAQGRGPAIIVFTNAPSHYLGDDELARGNEFMIMGLNEENFQPQIIGAMEENFPGLIRAASAFGIPIPSQWD